jgi:hypothetical protein
MFRERSSVCVCVYVCVCVGAIPPPSLKQSGLAERRGGTGRGYTCPALACLSS